MVGHKICFYGEMWLIIPELSLLLLLIWSSAIIILAYDKYKCSKICKTLISQKSLPETFHIIPIKKIATVSLYSHIFLCLYLSFKFSILKSHLFVHIYRVLQFYPSDSHLCHAPLYQEVLELVPGLPCCAFSLTMTAFQQKNI